MNNMKLFVDLQDISINKATSYVGFLSTPGEYAYHIYDCSTEKYVMKGAWKSEHQKVLTGSFIFGQQQ